MGATTPVPARGGAARPGADGRRAVGRAALRRAGRRGGALPRAHRRGVPRPPGVRGRRAGAAAGARRSRGGVGPGPGGRPRRLGAAARRDPGRARPPRMAFRRAMARRRRGHGGDVGGGRRAAGPPSWTGGGRRRPLGYDDPPVGRRPAVRHARPGARACACPTDQVARSSPRCWPSSRTRCLTAGREVIADTVRAVHPRLTAARPARPAGDAPTLGPTCRLAARPRRLGSLAGCSPVGWASSGPCVGPRVAVAGLAGAGGRRGGRGPGRPEQGESSTRGPAAAEAATVVRSAAEHLRTQAAPARPVLAWLLGRRRGRAAAGGRRAVASVPAAVPSRTQRSCAGGAHPPRCDLSTRPAPCAGLVTVHPRPPRGTEPRSHRLSSPHRSAAPSSRPGRPRSPPPTRPPRPDGRRRTRRVAGDAAVIVLLLGHLVVGLGLVAWGGRASRLAVALAAVVARGHGGLARGPRPGCARRAARSPRTCAWVPAARPRPRPAARRLRGAVRRPGVGHRRAGRSPTAGATSPRRRRRPGPAARAARRCSPARCSALVLADNLLVLFGFWELTSITSFLLIGNDHTSAKARAAALQALLVTGAGGLAMLGGLRADRPGAAAADRSELSEVLADPPSGTTVTVGLVLVLVGAFTKSAQYPFHSWLPGAMVAPDAGQHLPALGHDGEGRRLPGRPVRARRSPPCGSGGRSWCRRPGHDGGRRPAGPAPERPQAAPRLRHGQPARLHGGAVRVGHGRHGRRRGCELLLAHAAVQGGAVHGRRHRRPPDRHPRHPPPPGPGAGLAAAGRWSTVVVGGVDGRRARCCSGSSPRRTRFAGLEPAARSPTRAWCWPPVVLASMLTVAYSLRFAWGALGCAGPPGRGARAAERRTRRRAGVRGARRRARPRSPCVFGVAPAARRRAGPAARRESLDPAVEPVHLALWHGVEPAARCCRPSCSRAALALFARPPARGRRAGASGGRVPSGGRGVPRRSCAA